jgi:hypothetical protein
MTDPPDAGFETLVYTDCLPGQGLQGTAGLQFQARSAGADRQSMAVVQRNLLYEPPAAWMRERRAVEDYPPSFAHIVDTVYATARGVYLGREANGGREGNQLTHGIVTRNPGAYRELRPAQLFGASFWTDRPAPTTTCPPLPDDWEPGPIDAAAAQEFVLAQPAGVEMLRALLAAFEQLTDPQPQRVLFIAEEADAVIRWIAAATLLMPQARAVRVGFKVFTTSPAYAAQPVVAVHPGWESTSVRVGSESGYLVFDLTRGEWTPVASAPDVDLRIRLFADHDPYDVVDLIELADQSTEPNPMKALALGQMMMLPNPQLGVDDARIAVRWLRDTPAALLSAHRGALADQLTAKVEQWPRDVLVDLDAVAASGQLPADRVATVRLALVEKELDRALRFGEVGAGRLPPPPAGTWNADDTAVGERMVQAMLRRFDLPPLGFDAVLRVAHRFGLPVVVDEIAGAVDAFVADWAEHPDRAYDPSLWPCGPDLRRRLYRHLEDRVVGGESDAVGDLWWRRLLKSLGELGTPLGDALIAAAMVHGSRSVRADLVDQFVLPAARGPEPAAALASVAGVLWSRCLPDVVELRELSNVVPPGVVLPARLTYPLVASLEDAPELTPALLDTAQLLIRRTQFVPSSAVDRLMSRDALLRRLCEELPTEKDLKVVRELGRGVGATDERLLRVWRPRLIEAMFAMPAPDRLAVFLHELPEELHQQFVKALGQRVSSGQAVREIVTAFYLSGGSKPMGVTAKDAEVLRERVHRYLARASDRHLKPVMPLVERLGKPWVGQWKEAREAAKGGRRWWSRSRGGEG